MKPINDNYEIAICVNCHKEFQKRSKGGGRKQLANGIKPRGAINCSGKCSREWRDKKEANR